MNQSLPIVTDLARVFPDIQGQLCSRHSILFGKLRNTYNKVYDNMDPQHYIMIKGVLELFSDRDVNLSMGLQNGIILMSRRLDCGAPIYINSNHFDSEIIMTSEGKLEEGLNEFVDEISIAVKAATEGVPTGELSGGIFYLHSNIAQNCFRYKEVMLISIFVGVALVNNNLNKFTLTQLVQKLQKYKIFGDKGFLQNLFKYENRKFTLNVGGREFKIPLEKQNKMIVCQVDLARLDIKFQQNRKVDLLQRKREILQNTKQKWGIESILQLFQLQDQHQTQIVFPNEIVAQDQVMNANNFLQYSLKQLALLSQFNNGNITFQQWVSAKWQLNSKYWKLHSQQVVQLVQQLKQTLKINSCMIIHQTFALMVADKSKYTELLVFLRQKLHKGELKSKSLFKIEEQLIQHRWGSDKQIGEKMFTSVPSCGVSVYDPSEAIWFD